MSGGGLWQGIRVSYIPFRGQAISERFCSEKAQRAVRARLT